ncbi:hypothetical protein QBC35DRAFT_298495 [Podospora australis]|uniref:Uncharacterized protein n=1 Tax=Podospora australis TaxID=1536484 RepID=A0AAN6WST5_9PEZI|nr:hypothetical protein QBC35DRAFT_298495 [Podospora australis]
MDPTSYNPNNITRLEDLRISYLAGLILSLGNNDTRNGFGCPAASMILPLSNLSILDIEPSTARDKRGNLVLSLDPANLNPGLNHLRDMARGLFPSPLNESSVGDIVTWWTNATINAKYETQDFLEAVVNMCGGHYCKSGYITVGNPDIVGIGMIVAIVMLLLLTLAFSVLSFGPLVDIIARGHNNKKRFSLRTSCIGTVDELFSAVFVFSLAVIVSTFVFRYRTDTRFDALMANALSQLCSTTVVMLAATYWAHNKQRPHATLSVSVVSILTIAMFTTHASVANMRASASELVCGIGKGRVSTIRGDPFDMKKFHFIPVGFGCWCVALFGAIIHHPWLHRFRPDHTNRKISRIIWKIGESLPSVFGLVCLVVYAAYFLNTWHMMKETYGKTFSKNVRTWGFGQYLAVFTWLPPILTFAHLFFSGMESAIERRLPNGWKAYPDDDNDNNSNDGSSPRPKPVKVRRSRDGNEQWQEMGRLLPQQKKTTPQQTAYQFPTTPASGGTTPGFQSPGYPYPSPGYPPTPYGGHSGYGVT